MKGVESERSGWIVRKGRRKIETGKVDCIERGKRFPLRYGRVPCWSGT